MQFLVNPYEMPDGMGLRLTSEAANSAARGFPLGHGNGKTRQFPILDSRANHANRLCFLREVLYHCVGVSK
jgi:hypothetical protein